MSEEIVYESERTQSRGEIASYLHRVARALERGEPVPVDEEQTVTVSLPEEPEFEVEVERQGGDLSLEFDMEWEEREGDVDIDAMASKADFELFEDSAGEYRWRLVHDNGNIIADGGEGYTDKRDATNGLESVRKNAPGASIVDTSRDDAELTVGGSDASFELFEDSASQWRWRLVHDNGNIIADGGEGYVSKQSARKGIESVKENVRGAQVETLE
jgi:amphi-Trp domain-containing protein